MCFVLPRLAVSPSRSSWTELRPDPLADPCLTLSHLHSSYRPEFRERILPHIDCVILSPGPGRPEREQDFGFCAELIREVDLPILGVCLGHQGIATSFGGAIKHVSEIQHGQRSKIAHSGKGLFAGVPQNVEMVTYNSLTVDRARKSL